MTFHTHPGLGDEQYDLHQTVDRYYEEGCKILALAGHDYDIPDDYINSIYPWTSLSEITSTKKTFSASELQRQLGHSRYEPIWEMLHKLRLVMGRRDDEYKLKEWAGLDEGFFKIVINHKVHTVISNAKRNLLGIHHMIGEDYLQNYLNEFCYKFNRKYFGEQLFYRLLIACASYSINDIR